MPQRLPFRFFPVRLAPLLSPGRHGVTPAGVAGRPGPDTLMVPVLELENVTAGYLAEEILRGVSLAVVPGEFVGVFGPNGAGKTTLLCAAAGLARFAGGRVRLGGETMTRSNAHRLRRKIGYVPQYFEVDGRFPISAREVVHSAVFFRRELSRDARRELEGRASSLAAMLELGPLLDRPFGQLSGGEKKKALIARALLQEPSLLFLDEVFAWLDHRGCREMVDFLARVHRAERLATILVSHDITVLERLCPRVVWLEKGRVVYDGPRDGFRRRLEKDA